MTRGYRGYAVDASTQVDLFPLQEVCEPAAPVKENGEVFKSGSTGFFNQTQGERKHRDEPWDSRQYRANTEPWHWKTAAAPPNASELSLVPVKRLTRRPSL